MPQTPNAIYGHRHPWAKWFTGSDDGEQAVIGRRIVLRRDVDFFGRPDTFVVSLRNKASAYGVGLRLVVSREGDITAFVCEKRNHLGRPKSNGKK